jgi:hypothetical protein
MSILDPKLFTTEKLQPNDMYCNAMIISNETLLCYDMQFLPSYLQGYLTQTSTVYKQNF